MFSAKLLFLLIASTFFLLYTSQEKQIRGLPEVDYPTYYIIPKTSFRCSDQLYNPGFYADTETRCQVFHYCYEHRQESFLCPMGTIFNQPILACDYWYSSNCSLAPSYYHVNADKRNDHYDEADDPLDSQSENLFDKMAHLYETNNKITELPVLKNDSDISTMELLGRDDVESSGQPLFEKNGKYNYNKYSYGNQFNMIDEAHPEVVKYEFKGVDTLNIYEGSEGEQPYETANVNDFVFSEDGTLHSRQEDIHHHPTDMNFNQEYSGYAEIPSEGNFKYDLNEDFDPESDIPISDFGLQKRYADANSGYVRRRPSSRKPVMVIPEAEPEIVKLPVATHKRKPIGMASTVDTNADTESLYETSSFNIYEEAVSAGNKKLEESTTSSEFPLNEPNFGLNDFQSGNPKLFYEIQEKTDDENGSQQHQTDRLRVTYDYYNKKKTRNAYALSNIDEDEISSVFGSGRNDVLSVPNVENQGALTDSNYDDEPEVFIGKVEGPTAFPSKNAEMTDQDESSFGSDLFFGSGSEEINQSHSRDRTSFPENHIFSDSKDAEIVETETSFGLPINHSDAFEETGISVQETDDVPNFIDVNESVQFVSKEHSKDNIEYEKESSFSSDTFGNFLPLENSEDDEEAILVPEGSGEFNGFDYLPHESQEFSDDSEDASDETVPEIREIDGSYYIFSDSEYNFNRQYEPSGFYSENVDYAFPENFEDVSDETTKAWIDNERSRYASTYSNLKIDNLEQFAQSSLNYPDSKHLEKTYEKLPDEFKAGTSSNIPEKIDDYERAKQLSTEDLKYLEILSQNPSPMIKNLFVVSNEKSSSYAVKDEMPGIESTEQNINEQVANYNDPTSMEDVYKFESLASDTPSDVKEHSTDIKFLGNNSELLNAEEIAEEVSNEEGSGEKSKILSPDQNLKAFGLEKESDPFNPLFAEGDKILLDGPDENKQKPPLKVSPVQTKKAVSSAVVEKDLKKTEREKRFNDNFPTFNPPKKVNPFIVPNRETFREAMFTNIPSAFLKLKHSTLRPYFYKYDLENSGFIPRAGDSFQSSKLSKLTSWGKRLLTAKSAKFSRVKKYIESYRS